ncbi:MAG: type II toxin-antitoxin system VapC family toxin [Candidatus Omnitrophica bacterium]|nr:type II toxin-antitoxin system VapC family toxin [Candidatus Omnitrophota bacterium]
MTLVLDASVLLKWFVEEPGSEAALGLKRRYLDGEVAIVIPDLALYEIPNVLRFKREVPEVEVKAALRAFWTLGLETVAPTEPLLEEAIHLSFATGLSLYDCAYLALTKELDATLITADTQLARAASRLVRTTVLR